MRMNAALKRALSAASRMSLPSTRAKPPPAAGPLTAAITGWGNERRCGTSEAMCFWTARPRSTLPCHSKPGAVP